MILILLCFGFDRKEEGGEKEGTYRKQGTDEKGKKERTAAAGGRNPRCQENEGMEYGEEGAAAWREKARRRRVVTKKGRRDGKGLSKRLLESSRCPFSPQKK